ncbi:sensor histidine kinase [Spirosoma sp. KNUC1025]|uniref:sensor histidine kinase n=1 Tax=Spirosoma sp. KNUC1025 TaxID=2894082 RepID=UPI00386D4D5E|nr:histidine kinase [Spirosoma sp. KNUC1025]
MSVIPACLLLIVVCLQTAALVQADNLPFKHLSVADGLPNGNVRAFTQDRYGFIWIGTDNGLCRFDGQALKVYTNIRHDSSSIPSSATDILCTDANGAVWMGAFEYIARFDDHTQTFRRFKLPNVTSVTTILEATPGIFWIGTTSGIVCFDRRKNRLVPIPIRDSLNAQKLRNCRVFGIQADDQGTLYVCTDNGLKVVNLKTQSVQEFHHNPTDPRSISDDYIYSVAPDNKGGVWLGVGASKGLVEHIVLKTGQVTKVNMRQFMLYQSQSIRINTILVERNGRVWIGGTQIGLLMFDPITARFEQHQQNTRLPSSLQGEYVNLLFQDRQGLLWLGMEAAGVNWCNPNRSLFTVFGETQNPRTSLPNYWARVATEDQTGNLWFGTATGLVVYQAGRGYIRRFSPADAFLPSYSIRALATDSTGAVFIGTSQGMNRFSPQSNRLRSYPEPDPGGGYFYWDLLVTQSGAVWAASTGGLRRYNARADRFEKMEADSLFKPYANTRIRCLAEAADGGLWIGTMQHGLIYWHPGKRILRHYQHEEGNRSSLVDDFITSIALDATGKVWVSTLNGLCVLDSASQTFRSFDHLFPVNRFSGLLFDDCNRLWMSSYTGLFCLDTDRQTTHRFDIGDGLPTDQFNDQRAIRLRDGRFCYATLQGFALFRPDVLMASERSVVLLTYLTKFSVFNQPHPLPQTTEVTQTIDLKPDENFFAFEWAALHYDNPEKCRYSYRLVGFDRGWNYPKTPMAQYTNVPGGDYDFEFRSTVTPGHWDGPVQRVHVRVATVYYKTGWFIGLVLLTIVGLAVGFYQYRMQHTIRVAKLKMQATSLEKANALVQYQNLINQLNPHFLFNSLAVLDGLITRDGKLASRYLSRLTKVYRYLIENDRVEVVALEKELRFLTDFIALLTTRYGGGFTAEVDIPESALQRKVVPVTLQNLIENAIKHNTTDEESPLRVAIRVEDDYLVVANNLQKRAVVNTSNRKGLRDLERLYRYLTDRPLRTEETDDAFAVYVPLLNK